MRGVRQGDAIGDKGGDDMGRAERRRDLARFRREACHELLTFLVPPDDPALRRAPLLRAAADHWLNALSTRVRSCIVCSAWLVTQRDVGALLLSTAVAVRPTSASVCGVCRACWDADLGLDAL